MPAQAILHLDEAKSGLGCNKVTNLAIWVGALTLCERMIASCKAAPACVEAKARCLALPRVRRRPCRASRRDLVCAAKAVQDSSGVVIVGAGLSGLACALSLHKAGVPFSVLEASDGVGGRVRTDSVDGFLLDRGFQIFLTAYPEAQATLDYEKLDLKPFYAGARVWWNGAFHKVSDPLRNPVDGVLSLLNPVGTVADKVLVGLLRFRVLLKSVDEILEAPEESIKSRLQVEGFTSSMTDKFFRPFMGGIFFDRQLGTSSRLFEFVMRTLASGDNCLPSQGIGALASNLENQLPSGSIKTGMEVVKCVPSSEGELARVELANGDVVEAPGGVVVAVEAPQASSLLGDILGKSPSKSEDGVGTCCLYFRAPSAPNDGENILYLNGEEDGVVNNCCFPSTVSASYAPPGETLVSVSTVGTLDECSQDEVEAAVRKQLSVWFGESYVAKWEFLRMYKIPFAQPNQAPPTNLKRPVSLGNDLYVCGDHRDTATFDGALVSGRRAAEAILSTKA
ncbi:hypothetical protein BSKO_04817 [Bryopsis sp. KO-2023]|nr:hypothetical protein BSKO_04817 [Bryopsis sp. KO-2023]